MSALDVERVERAVTFRVRDKMNGGRVQALAKARPYSDEVDVYVSSTTTDDAAVDVLAEAMREIEWLTDIEPNYASEEAFARNERRPGVSARIPADRRRR